MDINQIINSMGGDLLVKRLANHQIVETKESLGKLFRHNVNKRIAMAKAKHLETLKGSK